MNRVRRITPRIGQNPRGGQPDVDPAAAGLWLRRHPALVPRPRRPGGAGRCPLKPMSADAPARGSALGKIAHPPHRIARAFVGRAGSGRAGGESRVWARGRPGVLRPAATDGSIRGGPTGRLGVLVNDARVGRAILLDDARFRSVGPGTHGELINEVMGPRGLLNMDGADARVAAPDARDLFAAGPARRLADETAAGPIAEAAGASRRARRSTSPG